MFIENHIANAHKPYLNTAVICDELESLLRGWKPFAQRGQMTPFRFLCEGFFLVHPFVVSFLPWEAGSSWDGDRGVCRVGGMIE